ncbi:GyrI-like domain-containing protein [Carnobacterium pleistocenium]|uniref:GyrI-like domain-containing protein n=1 Tax=Carnobacterium pleistocenium TaxID=181073 RepID=UPI000AB64F1E|nr:GyrI-like domain-containing protein [Carnobacterium pleistocenium]
MNKFEWKKHSKELYLPKQKPAIIEVPEMKFFTIEGKGNPNSEPFKKNIETLYSLSYAVKMMSKKGMTPEGYFDYTVFPLEGYWDLDEKGRKLDYLNKDHLVYKLMIRQPDFVTEDVFHYAMDNVNGKKKAIDLEGVRFESITEGLCVQALHIGSYEGEPETFELME